MGSKLKTVENTFEHVLHSAIISGEEKKNQDIQTFISK